MLRPLYPKEKNRCYPLNRRLCGPQMRSGCFVEQTNIFFSCPEWKHDSSLVTIPTELLLHVVVRKHELEGTAERAQSIASCTVIWLNCWLLGLRLALRWCEGFRPCGLLGRVTRLLTPDVSEERSAFMFWIRTRKK